MKRKPILDAAEFYAHALAIEREAVQRYRDFEAYFADRGDDVLAGLCHNLSALEGEHLQQLTKASRGLDLPHIDTSCHDWFTAGREGGSHPDLGRVADARDLLEIALHCECDALGFFEWVANTAPDEAVRSLAGEMAGEEMDHVAWVRNAIEYSPGGVT